MTMHSRHVTLAASIFSLTAPALADVFTINAPAPAAPGIARYMGQGPGSTTIPDAAKSLTFGTLGYDNASLLLNGKPWLPVMGEFHFSRYPAAEWRDELLKMKAGGITLVSTYVFWIHHEEVQGQFDWSGQRDLHKFIQTCADVGLPVIVRIGPWCHGEVRNGGMPDWADAMPRKRSTDPAFMAAVRALYTQVASQFKGLLWKDGGAILGIQVDNENADTAYLLALKNLARDVGIDTPIYTKTGWPAPRQPVPYGELMPLFGGYAEGFWDRTLDTMPGSYWQSFTFSSQRMDTATGTDIFGQRAPGDQPDTLSYPYLTCELGGGMMTSYHRRILINPMDAYALAIAKVGSGSNMPGYYMYQGGTNPDSKLTDMMQETQSRRMANDLPYKTYDFQAPLGEFGQVRESYNLLRRLHLFLKDYGESLARMPAIFPTTRITKTDNTDLRYSLRSDGQHGYLFINNYQRALDMPAKKDLQFQINLATGGNIKIPDNGTLTAPANNAFILPVNMDLGDITLTYATAQPLCSYRDPAAPAGQKTHVFAEIPGIPAEFVFEKGIEVQVPASSPVDAQGRTHVSFKTPSSPQIIIAKAPGGQTQVIELFSQKVSEGIYKGTLNGHEQLIVSDHWNIVFDGNRLVLSGEAAKDANIEFRPEIAMDQPTLISGAKDFDSGGSTIGTSDAAPIFDPMPALLATFEQTQKPGPAREVKMGSQKVAEQPAEVDWAQAAVYRIKLPQELANLKTENLLLRLTYAGDVARVYLDGKLIDDNFYNGNPFELGLNRFAPDIFSKELLVKILPLKKDAPIYLLNPPTFAPDNTACTLQKAELIRQQQITLQVK